jgi:hypothetical protein
VKLVCVVDFLGISCVVLPRVDGRAGDFDFGEWNDPVRDT